MPQSRWFQQKKSSGHICSVSILYNTIGESTACSFNIHDLKENPTGGKVFTEAIQGQAIFHADNGKIGKMRAIRRPLEIFLAISTGIFLSIFHAIFHSIFHSMIHTVISPMIQFPVTLCGTFPCYRQIILQTIFQSIIQFSAEYSS